MGAVYIRVARLITSSNLSDSNFSPNHFERKLSTVNLNPALYNIKDRINLGDHQISEDIINILTNGSKIQDKTGSAYCLWSYNTVTEQWMVILNGHNSVFQAEIVAIREACIRACQFSKQSTIWSDSNSSLLSASSFKSESPIPYYIQQILHNSTTINLAWVKAQDGTPGNESADHLAK
ncbi:hypothetical protein AVEN_49850-1 [Araneus ventricosus]|uniref:RNase H type-1 domain-containing protein n=1 Tax=Araneus ventricosus TaxID=182803 RepID=A0A4Y2SDD4_ARAVE|nr:hypothetical protein AVEN_49850-1 [Araneus ventricosus]